MTDKVCFGISSRCFDGKHILLGDIDKLSCPLDLLKSRLREIQECYNLPNIYMLSSTSGFNFFSLCKLHITLVKDILLEVPNIDKEFVNIGFKRGYYVLRMDKDKQFMFTLNNKSERKLSFAHKIFFQNMLDMTIDIPYWQHDNSLNFKIVEYVSSKNGYYVR